MFRKLIASKELRRRTAFIIFIFLVLPFAIYGISSRQMAKPAGRLFGKNISMEDFQSERSWVMRQMRNQLGDASDALSQMEPFINQTVWDRLMLVEEARRQKLKVDDDELARFIRQIPGLQESGRFDKQRYHRFMAGMGITPQQFEQQLKNDLTIEKAVNRVKTSVAISDQEVREAFNTANEQLTASVLFFDPKAFASQASSAITEEALRSAYDERPDWYRIEEQLTFEYAGISRSDLSGKITVDDAALEKFYQDHLDDWPKSADGATQPLADVRDAAAQRFTNEQIQKTLTNLSLDIQDDLDAKKSYDEITTNRQLNKKTAGPLSPSDMWAPNAPEPALLQSAGQLDEGESSDLVKTDQGVYLVKLLKRVPGHVPPFEEVREKARKILIEEESRKLAKQEADAAHEHLKSAMASGKTMDEALAALSPVPAAASWTFTRTGPIGPLGSAPAANQAAFEAAEGGITGVIESSAGFAILKPEKKIPADASKLAENESKYREEALAKRQSERTTEWLSEVRVRAKLKSFVTPPDPNA